VVSSMRDLIFIVTGRLTRFFKEATATIPIVSVSDDLHFQAVVSEDANPNKKLVNAAHISVEHFATILLVLGALLAGLFRVVGSVRSATAAPYLSSLLDHRLLGRAPPLSAAV